MPNMVGTLSNKWIYLLFHKPPWLNMSVMHRYRYDGSAVTYPTKISRCYNTSDPTLNLQTNSNDWTNNSRIIDITYNTNEHLVRRIIVDPTWCRQWRRRTIQDTDINNRNKDSVRLLVIDHRDDRCWSRNHDTSYCSYITVRNTLVVPAMITQLIYYASYVYVTN